MRKLLALSVLLLSLGATSTAQAQMSTVQLRGIIHHSKCTLRFFKNHPEIRTEERRIMVRKARASLRWAERQLYVTGFPPHHALWVCIHNNEGPWNDHDGGYDGGLQMSQGWFNMFKGSAGYFSQAQQEWFAEKAYAANGYSWSFLNQQWFKWDNADYCAKYG